MTRFMIFISTLLYIIAFNITHIKLIVPIYCYTGLTVRPINLSHIIVTSFICLIPALWMRIEISRPSYFLFLLQYYIIFIPTCFVIFNSSKPQIESDKALIVVLLMLIGLLIIQSIYYIPLKKLRYPTINASLFWVIFYASMAALILYTVVFFGRNFRFTNLEDIYSVRSALEEAVNNTGSRFGFYAQMWLAGFFFPFCMAIGLILKQKWPLLLAVAGYLLLFGVSGSKTTLLSLIYFPAIFIWLKYSKQHLIANFAIGLSCLLLCGLFLGLLGFNSVAHWYVAVVNNRIFTVPAQLIIQYYDFFSNNPVTHLSHVSGIKAIIHYPYNMDIPALLGIQYFDTPVGSNAGFWAGDGLAGFGAPGIIIMSVACAVLFWIFDSIAARWKASFVILATTFIATSFGNISLFTVISSGGLGFLMITLLVAPSNGILRPVIKSAPDQESN